MRALEVPRRKALLAKKKKRDKAKKQKVFQNVATSSVGYTIHVQGEQ